MEKINQKMGAKVENLRTFKASKMSIKTNGVGLSSRENPKVVIRISVLRFLCKISQISHHVSLQVFLSC